MKSIETQQKQRQAKKRENERFIVWQREKAVTNWERIHANQKAQVFMIDHRVVVRDLQNGLKDGVITGMNADGTYIVKLQSGEAVNLLRSELLLAPSKDEVVLPGARVAVAMKASNGFQESKTGVVMSRNNDGTFVVNLDDAGINRSVASEHITLFHNDTFCSHDRVLVRDGRAVHPAVIMKVHPDLTYDLRYDSGTVQTGVARSVISSAPETISFFSSDEVKVVRHVMKGKGSTGSLETAMIVDIKPDQSYVVRMANSGTVETIKREEIVAYYNGVSYVHVLGPQVDRSVMVEKTEEPNIQRATAHMTAAQKAKFMETSRTIKKMKEGALFIQYFKEGRRQVFMFYVPPNNEDEKGAGSLCWNDPTSDPRYKYEEIYEQTINLRMISDIFMGKKETVFVSQERNKAKSKACFSILSKNKSCPPYNFEADVPKTRSLWINGVNAIITGKAGKAMLVRYNDAAPTGDSQDRGRTLLKQGSSSPGVNPENLPKYPTLRRPVKVLDHAPAKYQAPRMSGGTMMRHATLSSMQEADFIGMMESGTMFRAYSVYPDESIQQIHLFLVRNVGRKEAGMLFWADPMEMMVSEENSLAVADISGIYVGKQSSVLRLPFAKEATWANCLSVISVDRQHDLHLEAVNSRQVSAWVEGLNGLFS